MNSVHPLRLFSHVKICIRCGLIVFSEVDRITTSAVSLRRITRGFSNITLPPLYYAINFLIAWHQKGSFHSSTAEISFFSSCHVSHALLDLRVASEAMQGLLMYWQD